MEASLLTTKCQREASPLTCMGEIKDSKLKSVAGGRTTNGGSNVFQIYLVCPHCGEYVLLNTDGTCPECGKRVKPNEKRKS